MEEIWILIFVLFFATNSLDKAESVQLEKLEELQLQTFDELFVEEWWDKDEAEDLKMPPPTNFGQNVQHQIDRQNTQIGQIEASSTDQLGQIESNSTDQLGQIEPNSTERMKKITASKNNAEEKRKQKFDQMKAELKRAGIKNSYHHEIDKTVAKELGLSLATIYNCKNELGQTETNKHPHSEQKELMKRYYEIKDHKPKISDKDIAKMLKIGKATLFRWKKQFKRQQLHPNFIDGHSVEANAGSNVQLGKELFE
uniref:Transposase n=1 Tax=Globodera rostochiensis TaxID=31243 RepID=A0A914H1L9_GLORO